MSCIDDDRANNFVNRLIETRRELHAFYNTYGGVFSEACREEFRKILESYTELTEEMAPKLRAGFQQPFGPPGYVSSAWVNVVDV